MADYQQPRYNIFPLEFPEPTEAEKQQAADRAAKDLAYAAAASVRAKLFAEARRTAQADKRLFEMYRGGIINSEPNFRKQDLTSTRGQRRREQLGRA